MSNLLPLLTSTLTPLALNPLLTSTLLYLLTRSPPRLRGLIIARIPGLKDTKRYVQVVKALKWCLAFGLAGVLNKQLNAVALNGGRWGMRREKERWDWGREVAVVTGGCGGIGEMMVRKLVGRGVRVGVVDVAGLPKSLEGYAHVKYFACDVTDPAAVYKAAEDIKNSLGAPTILINNAGILSSHTILNTPDEYLRKIFDVNVLSNWYTTKAFLPSMIAANKGHIVTIASGASYIGVAGLADYTASKAAILSFHEALNQELRHIYKAPNVLTTSVHPSWIRTPLIASVEDELKSRGASIIEPDDAAQAVVDRIFGCTGGQVFLPAAASKASMLRALPNWLQERMRDGVSKTVLDSAAKVM